MGNLTTLVHVQNRQKPYLNCFKILLLYGDWIRTKLQNSQGNVPFEEATLLKLNCDKALAYLHWHSTLHYDECVNFIAEWYRAFYVEQAKDMFALTEKQINAYMEAAKKQNLDWAK